jgi:hypothetical protein
MSFTGFTTTGMKRSFFLHHIACPVVFSRQAYHKCSSYFWTNT